MTEELATIRKFLDPVAAVDFVKFLENEQIPYLVEDASETFDPAFAFNTLNKEIHVKVKPGDFEKVEQLLLARTPDVSQQSIPQDYYLLKFSEDELFEVLQKPDEWNPIDYQLAQRILKDRGREVTESALLQFRKQRKVDLAQPEKARMSWIFAGYLFAVLGALLGIFIGSHLLAFKKTLPDGSKVYAYTEPDRLHGRRILLLGLVFLVIFLIQFFQYKVIA